MSLTVWGRASSSNVQAVMWGLTEMGLTAERIDIGGRFGGTDDPAFRAMNPMGLVPVLKDGGDQALFESAAILRYLAARYGGEAFWPSDVAARAQADKWAEWAKTTLCAAFTVPIFWAHWRTPEADRDKAAIAKAIHRFEGFLRVIPQVGDGFIAGPSLSLGDIWAGHVLFRYFALDIDRSPPEFIVDYYDRLQARPAYRDHVMIDYSELKGIAR